MSPRLAGTVIPRLERRAVAAERERVARELLRPGGRLVYATCTFRREEDEEVALAFEAAHPEYARLVLEAAAPVRTPEGFVRTWPHRHGTDGFFAAVWDLPP